MAAEAQPRKKFAKPPVKLACLSCRASRIRCDGKETCQTCLEKGKQCVYTPSKRGGPRYPSNGVRKKKTQEPAAPVILSFEDQFLHTRTFQIPGAGLKHLDQLDDNDLSIPDSAFFDDILQLDNQEPIYDGKFDQINEDLFTQNDFSMESSNDTSDSSPSDSHLPDVRLYGSEADLLEAYYVYIHPYFPILPPPLQCPPIDRPLSSENITSNTYEPTSPLTLALSALLSLIPLPHDEDPRSPESTWKRRSQAHIFAQRALEQVEIESELIDSGTNPSKALTEGPQAFNRTPFHPNTPLNVESILALLSLSIYEYAQRGNLAKMRNRAGQALNLALDMGLYREEEEVDNYSEGRRRAWWLTYLCATQGSVVGNTRLTVDLNDQRFKIPYPTHGADPDVWSFFIASQQSIAQATIFVLDLNECLDKNKDLSEIYARSIELENIFDPLCKAADTWIEGRAANQPVDPAETVVVKALRAIGRIKMNSARIKLHRYSAFMDIPIFTEKHCDLKAVRLDQGTHNLSDSPAHASGRCDCGDMLQQAADGLATATQSEPLPTLIRDPRAPFTSAYSANICRRAALNIAQSFETIPYPNPLGLVDLPTGFPLLPRTMPSFACCAMQSSYALLMLCYKAVAENPGSPNADNLDLVVKGYIDHLQEGLRLVLKTLDNYSLAFEALDGMREQIQQALASSMFVSGTQ